MRNPVIDAAFWSAALTLEQYASGMGGKYVEKFRRRLGYVALDEATKDQLQALTHICYVLVMTEDWCGDAVFNIPIVVRMVEALPNAEIRLVYRSANAALNAHYEARAITHVPVITFFDSEFNELATWVERAQKATQSFEDWKTSQPDFLAIRYSEDLDAETKAERLASYYAQLIEEMFAWYDGEPDLQQATINELLPLITGVSNVVGE